MKSLKELFEELDKILNNICIGIGNGNGSFNKSGEATRKEIYDILNNIKIHIENYEQLIENYENIHNTYGKGEIRCTRVIF